MLRGPMRSASTALDRIHIRNAWRILPVLVAGYVLNTLCKTNIGFAALQMNDDLGLGPSAFGIGAGLFFVTYVLFEIPSNLLLPRVGGRRWLARILIGWGVAAMAMALTAGPLSFAALRMLLGLAEAGWYPGVLFFLSLWFPSSFRARATTLFYLGVPISAVLGSPLSGALISLPQTFGLKGWQWMFVIEGLPCVLLGFAALKLLRDTPEDASWLDAEEKRLLAAELSREDCASTKSEVGSVWSAEIVKTLALFSVANFLVAVGLVATFLWLPTAVKSLGALSNIQTGFVSAVPFVFAAVSLLACAASSDRFGERKWHITGFFWVGGLAIAAIIVSPGPFVSLVLLSIGMVGAIGAQGTFYAFATESIRRADPRPRVLAAGIAVVTTIGNIGGLLASVVSGQMVAASGGVSSTIALIAASFLAAGALISTITPILSHTDLRRLSVGSAQ